MSAGKNVGFNKWYFSTNGSLDVIDDYLRIIQLRSTNTFFRKYWSKILEDTMKINYDRLATVGDQLFAGVESSVNLNNNSFNSKLIKQNFIVFNDAQRWVRRGNGSVEPVKFIKKFINEDNNILFGVRFAQPENSIFSKPSTNNPYLVIKQKRYALKKQITQKMFQTHVNDANMQDVKSNFFIKNNVGENASEDLSRIYRFFKKNKVRDEMFNVATSRRMLRTQRTLVLPAHVNITAITNSYDVVHS